MLSVGKSLITDYTIFPPESVGMHGVTVTSFYLRQLSRHLV